MLYRLLLLPSRVAIYFYCRKIIINNSAVLRQQGPMLIAANHPNSFLDAIIVATLFKSPVYSLARGDAFAGKLITRILTSFNMLPVYRVSEGVENLENNYTTFSACQQLFAENKIVLIFSEGKCVNEWHLRPLKKGTARLALNAWQQQVPLTVIPLGINYSSFRKFGKNVRLNFGEAITQNDMQEELSSGKAINEFNFKLKTQLQELVFESKQNNPEEAEKYFDTKTPFLKKAILFIPAVVGLLLNAPMYLLIHVAIVKFARDHYDSIMTGVLFLFYPLYVIAVTLLIFFITKSGLSFLLLLLMPFTAFCLLHYKSVLNKRMFN